MLRSSSHMTYSGVSFEKLLCLIPLGSALTVVAVVHFQPSVNRDIAICVESLRNLTFKDSLQRVSIGPAYARVSQLIATVTRSGMAFSVLTVYRYLAKAMSETTYMAHDGGEWRSLCHSVLRTCQTYQVNAVMPRDILDDTMSSLRRMMDQEADDRGLDISFGESFMPSSVSPLQDRPNPLQGPRLCLHIANLQWRTLNIRVFTITLRSLLPERWSVRMVCTRATDMNRIFTRSAAMSMSLSLITWGAP